MILWNFTVYVRPNGRNDVFEAIEGHDVLGREFLRRYCEHLAITPKTQWQEPHAKKLTNEDPIYEIRYKANLRATRALGYFSEDGHTFIIVLICYHKGRVYEPPSAFKIAHNRIKQIKKGTAETVPLKIDGENVPADESKP